MQLSRTALRQINSTPRSRRRLPFDPRPVWLNAKCPPACPAWGWGQRALGAELQSLLRVRADCGGRLFKAKLGIVLRSFLHQLLDHLLTDEPILLARQFCDCLRDRINDVICFIGIDFA